MDLIIDLVIMLAKMAAVVGGGYLALRLYIAYGHWDGERGIL